MYVAYRRPSFSRSHMHFGLQCDKINEPFGNASRQTEKKKRIKIRNCILNKA